MAVTLRCPTQREAVTRTEAFLAARGLGAIAEDVISAMIEGIANAISHARTDYTLSIQVRRNHVIIDIIDYGPGFAFGYHVMPSPLATGGRGIPLMQYAMDDVIYQKRPQSNRLRLRKRFPLPLS